MGREDMKDMTVEELEHGMKLVINSDCVDLILKLAITNCWNELLRRFEVLEKENKNLRCCGNCSKIHKYDCAKRTEEVLQHCTAYQYPHENNYCDSWQSDGLTRAEREGK